ncbi:MAG: helix-hairpin-helix domain-containing protein, partial [Chloroflexi bacterium]|nr:helix-hairpin-helix domain-containing protein [Chloroflexota bacterium]
EPLKRAIVSEDAGIITSIPGIGKKTAQRLILELKEKLAAEGVGMSSPAPGGAAVNGAYDALLALGYSVVEAREALQGFKGEPVVEELIKFALQKLAVRK